MGESFLTVAQQVMSLFLLIGIGVICGKAKILNTAAVKSCADLVLLFSTPCVIVQSFQRPLDASMLSGLGIAALAAVGVHIVSIGIARLVFRDADRTRRTVLRFGTVFSNAGYMALPLQQALLGSEGVFYGAAYVAVFNLFLWSYGLLTMSGDRSTITPRKLLLNPGMIGLLVGLPLFLLSWSLPEVVMSPVRHLAALNTPVPMLIIGFYLADTNLRAALRDRRGYIVMALRLVVIPLITVGASWLCGVGSTVLVACTIAASAPVAAATTMFATKYEQDTRLSVNLVSLSTLLSMITMPLIVGLSRVLA